MLKLDAFVANNVMPIFADFFAHFLYRAVLQQAWRPITDK